MGSLRPLISFTFPIFWIGLRLRTPDSLLTWPGRHCVPEDARSFANLIRAWTSKDWGIGLNGRTILPAFCKIVTGVFCTAGSIWGKKHDPSFNFGDALANTGPCTGGIRGSFHLSFGTRTVLP